MSAMSPNQRADRVRALLHEILRLHREVKKNSVHLISVLTEAALYGELQIVKEAQRAIQQGREIMSKHVRSETEIPWHEPMLMVEALLDASIKHLEAQRVEEAELDDVDREILLAMAGMRRWNSTPSIIAAVELSPVKVARSLRKLCRLDYIHKTQRRWRLTETGTEVAIYLKTLTPARAA